MKELAAQKFPFFIGIKEPDIALMNLVWFYNHFCSITLKDSLNLAFDELYNKLSELDDSYFTTDKKTLQYQLFCIGLLLSSYRINIDDKLDKLFNQKGILSDPIFVMLFDYGIEIVNPKNSLQIKQTKKINHKQRKAYYGIKYYLENTADDLRLTTWENIKAYKSVEIYTEGKTDAEIIEHAYKVLTNDNTPYWNIRACNNLVKGSAGANELSKFLMSVAPKIANESDKNKIVIGIFDNDAKGIQEFGSLKSNVFDSVILQIVRFCAFGRFESYELIRFSIAVDTLFY